MRFVFLTLAIIISLDAARVRQHAETKVAPNKRVTKLTQKVFLLALMAAQIGNSVAFAPTGVGMQQGRTAPIPADFQQEVGQSVDTALNAFQPISSSIQQGLEWHGNNFPKQGYNATAKQMKTMMHMPKPFFDILATPTVMSLLARLPNHKDKKLKVAILAHAVDAELAKARNALAEIVEDVIEPTIDAAKGNMKANVKAHNAAVLGMQDGWDSMVEAAFPGAQEEATRSRTPAEMMESGIQAHKDGIEAIMHNFKNGVKAHNEAFEAMNQRFDKGVEAHNEAVSAMSKHLTEGPAGLRKLACEMMCNIGSKFTSCCAQVWKVVRANGPSFAQMNKFFQKQADIWDHTYAYGAE